MIRKLRDTEKHLRSINEEYRMLEAFCMQTRLSVLQEFYMKDLQEDSYVVRV